MLPQADSPYSIETSTHKSLRFNKKEAEEIASELQSRGSDVEVYHNGQLQFKLNGKEQLSFF